MSFWMESTKLFILSGQVLCGLLLFTFFMKGKMALKIFKGIAALFIINQTAQLGADILQWMMANHSHANACEFWTAESLDEELNDLCQTMESNFLAALVTIDALAILFLGFLLYLIHSTEPMEEQKEEKEALLPTYSA
jgi:hypothetical protein